jgi:hypothetical protein
VDSVLCSRRKARGFRRDTLKAWAEYRAPALHASAAEGVLDCPGGVRKRSCPRPDSASKTAQIRAASIRDLERSCVNSCGAASLLLILIQKKGGFGDWAVTVPNDHWRDRLRLAESPWGAIWAQKQKASSTAGFRINLSY